MCAGHPRQAGCVAYEHERSQEFDGQLLVRGFKRLAQIVQPEAAGAIGQSHMRCRANGRPAGSLCRRQSVLAFAYALDNAKQDGQSHFATGADDRPAQLTRVGGQSPVCSFHQQLNWFRRRQAASARFCRCLGAHCRHRVGGQRFEQRRDCPAIEVAEGSKGRQPHVVRTPSVGGGGDKTIDGVGAAGTAQEASGQTNRRDCHRWLGVVDRDQGRGQSPPIVDALERTQRRHAYMRCGSGSDDQDEPVHRTRADEGQSRDCRFTRNGVARRKIRNERIDPPGRRRN